MKTNRTGFLKTLSLVMPGIASQEIVEQSSSFVFSKGKVITFNDEIAVQHPIDIEIEGAVRAKEFYSFLDKCTGEDVVIEITDDGKMLIKSGRRRTAGIALEQEITLPIEEIEIPEKWMRLPENFVEGCQICQFSVSKDMSRPILTCLHLKDNFVESGDGYRLTKYTLSSQIKKPFAVPASTINGIEKYSPVKYALSSGWIHFKGESGVVYSCRTYTDQYPDTSKLLNIKKGKEVEFPASMKNILERVHVFAKKDSELDEFIKVSLENNTMTIKGENDVGWAEEKIKVPYKDKPITFEVNPKFLVQIINHLDSAVISAKEGRAKFVGDNFVHILCLLNGE